jgi:hypothetical protein
MMVCMTTNTTETRKAIRKLEAAYLRAHRAEMKAVDALPESATKAQTDRCWALAAKANAARAALSAALDALEMVGCGCNHGGEEGTITAAYLDNSYGPMLRVEFGARVAVLKPTEIGASKAAA